MRNSYHKDYFCGEIYVCMTLSQRIETFIRLGETIKKLPQSTIEEWADLAGNENRWFTTENVKMALEGIEKMLQKDALENWIAPYTFSNETKRVGIVMAGNIPLVGFHDLLSVLMSGHSAYIKLSSQDSKLLPLITDLLISIEPKFKEQIFYIPQLKDMDAVIATGSNNSARYFKQYFGKQPNIIRKNRTSCAIVTGNESDEELIELGKDIFSYYGLGCRNVSKIYAPKGYDFKRLLSVLDSYEDIGNHSKWRNNYDYNKSIYLVNKEPHLDNGFLLVKESPQLVSPLSVLYYEEYESLDTLSKNLKNLEDKIQCIVGKPIKGLNIVPFGEAQYPEVWDYADGVDTLKFLFGLK